MTDEPHTEGVIRVLRSTHQQVSIDPMVIVRTLRYIAQSKLEYPRQHGGVCWLYAGLYPPQKSPKPIRSGTDGKVK